MTPTYLPESIARRFHRRFAPSVVACAETARPVIFSHVSSDVPMPAHTLPPPVEDAYAFHVHHVPIHDGDMWLEGKHRKVPPTAQGGIFIFDLRTTPIAQLHQPFEFSRFQLTRAAILEVAYEQGTRRITDLRAAPGTVDPVVRHLALAISERAAMFGQEVDSLFIDGIALAFFSHVMRVYGEGVTRAAPKGALAPWQFQRIVDWVECNLDAAVSIDGLAALIGVSGSHLARAFAATTGMPPHRWLTQRRFARAKTLLYMSDLPLSAVAASCGFVDQSHFTRVFARLQGVTPARFRQQRR